MPKTTAKEIFIPYRRADIIQMCLDDGKLNEQEKNQFRTFCAILIAYYHFQHHALLERLKDHFATIDPDPPFKPYRSPSTKAASNPSSTPPLVDDFFRDLQTSLTKANFRALSEEELKSAFQNQSLIHLNTEVDFNDYERYLFYYRGAKELKTTIKHLKLWEKEISFETLGRVVLVTQFKDRSYFEKKKTNLKKLNFVPGRTYLYFFKNIPKADLEIIFPNVKISMTLKDKLLFLIPLFGVGLSTLFKMYGNLLILIGLILLTLGLTPYLDKLGIRPEMIPDTLIPMIAIIASITVVLGGFAIKQYINYKNKWIEFLNDVTQNLFFRSISINAGVFQSLIDAAEESECKEAILAYYHLLTHQEALTKEGLDATIENWFKNQFDTEINFDVEDALDKLYALQETIRIDREGNRTEEMKALLSKEADGTLTVLPLSQSIQVLDRIWDQVFQHDRNRTFEE